MNTLRRLWPFVPPLDKSFSVTGVTTERRPKDLLEKGRAIEQERADMAVEKKWRENVRLNEIRRLEQKLLERVDAELPDLDPEFDDWRDAAAYDAGVPRFGEI